MFEFRCFLWLGLGFLGYFCYILLIVWRVIEVRLFFWGLGDDRRRGLGGLFLDLGVM